MIQSHHYGPNYYKLHSLPVPRPGQILGIVGNNGIGKSTAIKILSGKNPPDWQEILDHFKGTELHNYFTRIVEDKVKVTFKPQGVVNVPTVLQGNVGQVLSKVHDMREMKQELVAELDLIQLMDRNVGDLSGGELQRFTIAFNAMRKAEIHLFDEPSTFLDVKQRLKVGRVVRSLVQPNNYVIVVEHDLSLLDYLSDQICCFYGRRGLYGVVTLPVSVREGINVFLTGFVSTENQFRTKPLKVLEGEYTDSEIIVLLGENGTGKTTFLQMLAGHSEPDSGEGSDVEILKFNVSYKEQNPLLIEHILDKEYVDLSGGELQKVALALCLGKVSYVIVVEHDLIMLEYLSDFLLWESWLKRFDV
ncbi:hypothetical protein SASPL_148646 [Salvia splendens]|uniref:ABC transporter domain-containing protein n=1 Tax=Salvia splendens TaxID=180675 RepID=A0A8X8WB73_SALSN|nr:hypothetical protein SASPL_148646 [Salvia splendens]